MAEELDALEEKKGKKGLVKWIILAVLLIGLGGAGWYFYPKFFGKPKAAEGANQTQAEAPAGEKPADKPGEKGGKDQPAALGKAKTVPLQPFVVNLSDPLGRRYLKLTIMVEMLNDGAAAELTAAEPKVRDQVIMLLSSKSFQDLASMESKMALKTDIVKRLNQILGGSKVLQVYFTEMVIQ